MKIYHWRWKVDYDHQKTTGGTKTGQQNWTHFFLNILICIWWVIKGILHSISTAECCSYCLWSFEYCNLKSKGYLQDREARKPCSLLCWAKIHNGYENFFLMWHIYQTWCYQIIICLAFCSIPQKFKEVFNVQNSIDNFIAWKPTFRWLIDIYLLITTN